MAEYRQEETLKRLYWDEDMTQAEIASEYGVSVATISRNMAKHGIENRGHGRSGREHYGFVERARFQTKPSNGGYEVWVDDTGPHEVLVHRLACVAWYGWDVVVGDTECHHENGVSWDNRQANLTPLSQEDHRRHHAEQMHDEDRL